MENELWEAFLLSGAVCDYLAYAGLRNEVSQNSEQKKITGLVIAQKNYRESDRLVTLLHSGGITRAYAKAAQNVKKQKVCGHSFVLLCRFLCCTREKSGLYIIDSADEKEVFFSDCVKTLNGLLWRSIFL